MEAVPLVWRKNQLDLWDGQFFGSLWNWVCGYIYYLAVTKSYEVVEGTVTEILGHADDPKTDILAVVKLRSADGISGGCENTAFICSGICQPGRDRRAQRFERSDDRDH